MSGTEKPWHISAVGVLRGMMKTIDLTQDMVALVADEDYECLNRWKWHARKSRNLYYAVRWDYSGDRPVTVYMHNVVLERKLGCPLGDGVKADHEDRNGLNNQRSNLREATLAQNGSNRKLQKNNTSGYVGVSWNNGRQRWVARIKVNRELRYLGAFVDPQDAALAYDAAAIKYHREFASTNKSLELFNED